MLSQNCHTKLMNAARAPYLLASFKKSTPPMVWYYDLRKMKNATINLREKEGEWELGTQQSDGDFAAVANFEDREDAEKALNSLHKAFAQTSFFPILGPWTRLLLTIIIVLICVSLYLTPTTEEILQAGAALNTTETIETIKKLQTITPDTIKPKTFTLGTPMNADDVLIPPTD